MAGYELNFPAERKEIMQEHRVLGRKGARDLTTREVESVTAAIIIHTNTACYLDTRGQAVSLDSSPYECGSDNPL